VSPVEDIYPRGEILSSIVRYVPLTILINT
jgi:hypothetical protein